MNSAVTEASVEAEVLSWFHEAWDPDLSLIEWRSRLVDAGWAVPSWSRRWFGRDLPAWADGVAHRAIRRAGGVAVPLGGGMGLAAPTMYDHASDELMERYLRPTLTGELSWCQLFSEPGAGSDLAGLKATAVRDGDEWIVNGQKVWNTSADHADMAILVARTDWSAVKHAGLSYFLLDMRQPGVEARPIRQMNRHASFNEVFLTDARIPHTNLVGDEGAGWAVARGTLAHERRFSSNREVSFAPGAAGRVVDEAKEEAEEYLATYAWYPQRAGRVDLVADRAIESALADDPVVRQAAVSAIGLARASEWTAARAQAARELGRPPGSEGSIGKLALSEVARRCHRAHTSIVGAAGMLSAPPVGSETAVSATATDTGIDPVIAEVLVSTPAQSIAGGTDEIQKNILGESMLGLPKEPSVDRGVPYRETLHRSG